MVPYWGRFTGGTACTLSLPAAGTPGRLSARSATQQLVAAPYSPRSGSTEASARATEHNDRRDANMNLGRSLAFPATCSWRLRRPSLATIGSANCHERWERGEGGEAPKRSVAFFIAGGSVRCDEAM